MSDSYVLVLRKKFLVPQDVPFYALREDERADQPPSIMIAINEAIVY